MLQFKQYMYIYKILNCCTYIILTIFNKNLDSRLIISNITFFAHFK